MFQKNTVFALILSVSLLLFAAGCGDDTTDNGQNGQTATYEIGDTGPSGGYIFYVDTEDQYTWTYLEASHENYEWDHKEFGGTGYEVGTAAQSTAIGTGAANTAAIVAEYGDAEPDGGKTDYAAKLCADLSVEYEGKTYDDWFLPSRDELWEIWWNLVSDQSEANEGNGAVRDDDIGNFGAHGYLSSTEDSADNSWTRYFLNGNEASSSKQANLYWIRAIRAF